MEISLKEFLDSITVPGTSELTYTAKQVYTCPSGEWDMNAVMRTVSGTSSKKTLAALNQAFPPSTETVSSEDESDVSSAEFRFEYEFGRFPHTKDWIKFWAAKGKKLSQVKLHAYLLDSKGTEFELRTRSTKTKVNVY